MSIRLPAEWEEQDGVLIAWPHPATDWHQHLSIVEPVFSAIVTAIARFERVIVVAPEGELPSLLADAAHGIANITCYPVPTNDTWSRDFGPIAIYRQGTPHLLDFGFNGWGLKFAADLDNQVTRRLASAGAFKAEISIPGLILEGGSIESDGNGTILTTSHCLLSPNRNPHLSKTELDSRLREQFSADRILWLEHGYLAGDDTDSHIDTLARLCPDDTILYVSCDDTTDEHYLELKLMAEQLTTFRTGSGAPFRLVPLPWPSACYDEDGSRLPATYANFLVINGAVLVPTYGDRKDEEALAAVALAFPGREIIGIDCLPLILQHGSLHCVTMHLPKGVLS